MGVQEVDSMDQEVSFFKNNLCLLIVIQLKYLLSKKSIEQAYFVDIVGGDDDDDDDDVPDLVENFDEVSKNEANAKTSKVADDDDGDGDDEDDEKSSPSALPTGKDAL